MPTYRWFTHAFVASLIACWGLGVHADENKESETAKFVDTLQAQPWDSKGLLSYLDPLLGFAHNPDFFKDTPYEYITGFEVYRSRLDPARPRLRIIALGGSTTDPLTRISWPERLHMILEAEGIAADVYNGGVQAYNTAQELFKLLRDALPLKPNIVIGLSGVNDLGFVHAMPAHPLLRKYHNDVLNEVLAPEMQPAMAGGYVKGINLGTTSTNSAAEHWLVNIRCMHALCREFGVNYLSVLQPILGVGIITPTPEEQKMLEDVRARVDYHNKVKEFYGNARREAKQLEFVLDLVDLFAAAHEQVYADARHQNTMGKKLLAQGIYDALKGRDWLNDAQARK